MWDPTAFSDDGFIRTVVSPVTRQMLYPSAELETIRFNTALTPRDLRRLRRFFRKFPKLSLSVNGDYAGAITDLSFLKYFPTLREFHVDRLVGLTSIAGLEHVAGSLESLSLNTSFRPSIALLSRFSSLTTLSLGVKVTDADVISTLTTLKRLTLWSDPVPSYDLLRPLVNLTSLTIYFGRNIDLDPLEHLPKLKNLEISRVRGLSDLSAISRMTALEFLELESLSKVDKLPDLTRLTRLRSLTIGSLKSVVDLTPLATSPSLQAIHLWAMRQISPQEVSVLKNIPTLRSAAIGLGSNKRNAEAATIHGLPDLRSDPSLWPDDD